MRRLLLAFFFSALALCAADLTGKWEFAVELSAGSGNPKFDIKQAGEKLSGTYSGVAGEAPLTGTIKGNEFEWTVKVSVNGQTATITYKGMLKPDGTVAGKCSYETAGDGTFTGKRA
jgi:hypothetical protein